jgi:uncharacterized membrane protein YqiK
MTKAVAIPYIIALVIGIIVVVLLIFLVYKAVTNQSISVAECRAKVTDWCNTCRLSGWSTAIPITDEIKNCGNLILSGTSWSSINSCGPDVQTNCKNTVGVE